MANPKQRHTRHRRDRARKQYDTVLKNTQECPKCQARILSHRVCPKCGTYKGKEMVNTAPKLKSDKKKKAA
ncbi:MAG: 50S ribosomal protein L32 [Candidatus Moranbacteria bacterium]|nr:50S ribosomal protein L32 [Candidatus Moranbacteria bacterium]